MKFPKEEIEAARIADLKEDIRFLSASVEGILKKLHALEKCTKEQSEINATFKEALDIIAEELELLEEGAES